MTVASINPYLPPPPDVGTTYGNIMDALFGTLTPAQKQVIWVGFLTANNLTEPVPPGNEELFYSYAQQLILQQSVLVPVYKNDKLSPEEIKKREIMFGVFNSVIGMLLSLQSTVTVEAQNIAVFAKWQREYTTMLTRVPSYVGGEASRVNAIDVNGPNVDWSRFTLGYNNVSVEDIARWWAQQRQDGSSDRFSLSSMYVLLPFTDNAFIKEYVTLEFTPTQIEFHFKIDHPFLGTIDNLVGTVPIAVATNFDQNVTNLEQAFKNLWNSPPDPNFWALANYNEGYYLNTTLGTGIFGGTLPINAAVAAQFQLFYPPGGAPQVFDRSILFAILKPYAYMAPANVTDPSNPIRNLSDVNAKARAEINSRDQQYIENIRSKRQVVQDVQSELQSNLDQSRQTLSQQTDLLNSIIDSLKGLIAAIYR